MNLEPIDTSTTAGKAEVMRRAAEGASVVCRISSPGCPWGIPKSDIQSHKWDWKEYVYAIIAEPVGPAEVFVYISQGGACYGYGLTAGEGMRKGETAVRYIRADLAGEVGE